MRLILAALLALTPILAVAQSRPPVAATHVGVYEVSQGDEWVDLDEADFTSITGRSIPAGACVASVTVTNTHATQTLRLLLEPSGGAGSIGILVPAGSSVSVPTYGAGVEDIAIRGSGAATTGQVLVLFVTGGC